MNIVIKFIRPEVVCGNMKRNVNSHLIIKNEEKNDEKEQSLKEVEMNKNLTEQLIKLSDEKKIVNNQNKFK